MLLPAFLGMACFESAKADAFTGDAEVRRLAECLNPFWQSGTLHNESVLLWAEEGRRPSAPLLFDADEIISVQDSGLRTVYERGRDWVYEGGKIILPEGSRIPWMDSATLYPAESGPRTMRSRTGGNLLYREGHFFHQHQLAITYRHQGVPRWNGPVPQLAENQLPRTLKKLRSQEPLKITVYGDSIAKGANSSGFGKTPVSPFQPTWPELLRSWLSHAYQHPAVTLSNVAVGGKGVGWGADNADERLAGAPDLVVIAFGMNNRGTDPQEFRGYTVRIMEAARRENPDVEIILVQSMLNNPDWHSHGSLEAFGDILRQLSGPGVAFCDMMSVHAALLERKRYEDMTGNHVNHPNDFLIRAYAQMIAGLLAPLPGPDGQPTVATKRSPTASVVQAGGFADALHPFVARLQAGTPQKIVFYGTSLTAGGAWVPQLSEILKTRFPGLVSFANGAKGGMTSRWGVDNLDANVLSQRPDVVFIEFSVNDAVARFDLSLDESRRNLENMLDRIRAANPRTDVILQVMNPILGRPPGQTSHRRDLSLYQDIYRHVGAEHGLTVIDHMPAWTALLESDERTFRSWVPDGLHPQARGYAEIVIPEIVRRLGLSPTSLAQNPKDR